MMDMPGWWRSEKPYIIADCLDGMKAMPDGCVDLIATDPPYALTPGHYGKKKYKGGFMGKEWDAQLPSKEIWVECLRVLKPGAFAFVMCAPRQDVLCRMIFTLEEAGFDTNFTSIYHVFAGGFPKSQNISKAIDKKACRKQLEDRLGRKPTKEEFDKEWKTFREDLGVSPNWRESKRDREKFGSMEVRGENAGRITKPTTLQAKAFEGSFSGYQPKPAAEIVLVCMRPLDEKTYVDQALKNGKGITWLGNKTWRCYVDYPELKKLKEALNNEEQL